MTTLTVMIAELHAAGYSNSKIGYLLPQHGARKSRSEATVRSWASRKAEPRKSDHDALERLHAAAIALVTIDVTGDGQMDKSIEVTPEMIEAGVEVLLRYGRLTSDYRLPEDSALVERLFLAMLSARTDETKQ